MSAIDKVSERTAPKNDLDSRWSDDHARAINQLIDAQAYEQHSMMEITAQGTGATKTTTTIIGNLIGEVFAVNDELYLTWHVPSDLDLTKDVILHTEWVTRSAEVAKTVSLDFATIVSTHTSTGMNGTTGTEQIVDQAIPATIYTNFIADVTLDAATYPLVTSGHIHTKLTRVASAADPVTDPMLHTAVVEYQIQRPDGESA